jgi:hypothetical protein
MRKRTTMDGPNRWNSDPEVPLAPEHGAPCGISTDRFSQRLDRTCSEIGLSRRAPLNNGATDCTTRSS